MKFLPASLPGVWLIEMDLRTDARGFFSRTYCEKEFAAHGLNTRWPQGNLTRTSQRGMIRGLHYQAEPKPEMKLVRCSAGTICDVVVDIRAGSPTYGRAEKFELTGDNGRQLYIPAGFAHGFQCLSETCDVVYQMSEFYHPELARGIRWDDRIAAVEWPLPNPILSERDQNLPPLPPAP